MSFPRSTDVVFDSLCDGEFFTSWIQRNFVRSSHYRAYIGRASKMHAHLCRSAAVIATLTALIWPDALSARRAPIDPGPPPLSDAECKVKAVNAQGLFIAAGVMQGDTLANVQLADPDSLSTIVRVEIAEGNAPITLFLHSDGGVIWDIGGEVSRVQRAIVAPSSKDRRVAVVGLPGERVEFPEFARCPQGRMFPPWTIANDSRDKAFRFFFGRLPDRIAFEGHPHRLALPATVFATTPKSSPKGVVFIRKDRNGKSIRTLATQDATGKPIEHVLDDQRSDAEYNLTNYYPGGFRKVDAGALISSVRILHPPIYPAHAGLIQLEQAGAIRTARREDFDALRKLSDRKGLRIDYVITTSITIPPGLHGAHTKNFLVPKGVPAPEGNPGHGCVYFADGRPAIGYRC